MQKTAVVSIKSCDNNQAQSLYRESPAVPSMAELLHRVLQDSRPGF